MSMLDTITTVENILKNYEISDSIISVAGWVKTVRFGNKGTLAFIKLNDGSCTTQELQVIYEKKDDQDWSFFESENGLNTGACIRATGKLVESPGKEQAVELHAHEIILLGGSNAGEYPVIKTNLTLEYLRSIPQFKSRSSVFSAIFSIRSKLEYSVHKFFNDHGFYKIYTPLITSSDCEGAGEMFQVTTLLSNKKDDISTIKNDKSSVDFMKDFMKDFFKKPVSLTVSGQLNLEIYACGMGKVYTFGTTFRAENSHTSRHLAEFTMYEPEIAFANLDDLIEISEQQFKYSLQYVLKECRPELDFLNKYYIQNRSKRFSAKSTLVDYLNELISKPFSKISYTDAIDVLQKSKKKFDVYPIWGIDLGSEHERYLAEQHFKRPVYITDYPKEIKSFYMKLNDDGKTVACTDCIFPGIGEVLGGSQREDSYELLTKRINELGLNVKDYEWYLDLRKFGSCPHSGWGVGFERLVMVATGLDNIRDTIPFPRYPGHCEL